MNNTSYCLCASHVNLHDNIQCHYDNIQCHYDNILCHYDNIQCHYDNLFLAPPLHSSISPPTSINNITSPFQYSCNIPISHSADNINAFCINFMQTNGCLEELINVISMISALILCKQNGCLEE